MKVNYEALATLLKYKREQDGVSMRDLAAETGVSASTISRAENGMTLEPDHLFALMDWLGIDVTTVARREYQKSASATITALLYDDPKLPKQYAALIAKTVLHMYSALSSKT